MWSLIRLHQDLTSLDIVAHELAHGVNQSAGDLMYA